MTGRQTARQTGNKGTDRTLVYMDDETDKRMGKKQKKVPTWKRMV